MKNLFLLLAMMLLSVSMVVAQDTPADPNATPEQQEPQAQEQPAAPADEAAPVDDTANQEDAGALPQTASPLPLLGLLGMGSVAAGLISRRK